MDRQGLVRSFAADHVVPILFEDPLRGLRPLGSGVPVKIAEHRFLFTAAHLLKAFADLTARGWPLVIGNPIGLVPWKQDNRTIVVEIESLGTGAFDSAVLKLTPSDEQSAADLDAASLTLEAVMPRPPLDAASWKGVGITLAGYPGDLAVEPYGGDAIIGVYTYSSGIAGDESPKPPPVVLFDSGERVPVNELVCMALSETDNEYDARSGLTGDDPPPRLGGASGGGYFCGVGERGKLPPAAELIAIHVASGSAPVTYEGTEYRFAFGCPPHHHLTVLFRRFPELFEHLHAAWEAKYGPSRR